MYTDGFDGGLLGPSEDDPSMFIEFDLVKLGEGAWSTELGVNES